MPRMPARSRSGYGGYESGPKRTWTSPVVREKVLALCEKRGAFVKAYSHPGCHRTSNPADRLLRRLDHHLYCAQHLHGSTTAAEQGLRGWALIPSFAPSCPGTVRETPGLRSPEERLNGKPYHPERLQNLLASASLAGYRKPFRKAGEAEKSNSRVNNGGCP
jgi:hypothetical protein